MVLHMMHSRKSSTARRRLRRPMLPPRSNQGAGGTLECVPSGVGQEPAEVVGEGGGGGGGGVVVALVAVRHDGYVTAATLTASTEMDCSTMAARSGGGGQGGRRRFVALVAPALSHSSARCGKGDVGFYDLLLQHCNKPAKRNYYCYCYRQKEQSHLPTPA